MHWQVDCEPEEVSEESAGLPGVGPWSGQPFLCVGGYKVASFLKTHTRPLAPGEKGMGSRVATGSLWGRCLLACLAPADHGAMPLCEVTCSLRALERRAVETSG